MKVSRKILKGFSLAEILLAIGIFGIISSSLILLIVDSTRTFENIQARYKATLLTQEIKDSILILKKQGWYNIARHTDGGEKHLEYIDGTYEIVDGEGAQGNLTYTFTVTQAQRDPSRNLVETGGTIDPHTRVVEITINWVDRLGQTMSISPRMYLNDWNTNSLLHTTLEDFLPGDNTYTLVQNISGGEVRLQSMFYADWCNPSLSMTSHDLPGQAIASSISTYDTTVLMGTGGNASGLPFLKATVSGEPPTVTIDSSYSSSDKVNDVFVQNNIALLATDSNAKEVIILNISSAPFTEIGYFDAAGPQDGTSVYKYGNKGFVTHGNTLSTFDLSSNNGSRPLITSVNLGATASDIFADESNLYITLTGSTSDFVIYQHTPTLTKIGEINLNTADAKGVFISEDRTRAYVITTVNDTSEFYIINIANKTNPTVISSFDTVSSGGLSPTTVAAIDNRAILAGTGGEEYTVLDITNETTPTRCGGLQINTGVNALSLVKQGINHYTYVVTKDSNSEFKIIRGGPGGGGADGNGYLPNGTYTSSIFNSGSDTSTYYLLGLTSTIPENTSLMVQLRTSNTPDMAGASWRGPDNTGNSFFSTTGVYDLDSLFTGRYFQYRALFESDTVRTPLLEEIIVNYEK
jgi:type II secretory pathway pseudopilin PulG